jgi:hypothetical protein
VRATVFLLMFANLLFFAWAQGYLGPPSNPDVLRVAQQLNAERVRIVARGDAPAEAWKLADRPAKTEEIPVAAAERAEPQVDACVRIADLPQVEGERIDALLAEGWPAFKAQRTTQEGGPSYWVYIPPLASKQDADNKAAELKRLRVPELFIVQESGAYNRAISLGLFSTRDAANARLEVLRALGVKSAKVGERGTRPAIVTVDISGPAAESDALRQALGAALPDVRLADCRPSAAP